MFAAQVSLHPSEELVSIHNWVQFHKTFSFLFDVGLACQEQNVDFWKRCVDNGVMRYVVPVGPFRWIVLSFVDLRWGIFPVVEPGTESEIALI